MLSRIDSDPLQQSAVCVLVLGQPGVAAAVTRETITISSRVFWSSRCMSQRYGMDSMAMPGRSLRYARDAMAWLQAALCSVSAGQCMSLRRLWGRLVPETAPPCKMDRARRVVKPPERRGTILFSRQAPATGIVERALSSCWGWYRYREWPVNLARIIH